MIYICIKYTRSCIYTYKYVLVHIFKTYSCMNMYICVQKVVESLALAIPFAVSHNFEDSDRDPIAESRISGKAVDWYKSQVFGCVCVCVTGWCTVLQRVALHCSVVQYVVGWCKVLQYLAVLCSVLSKGCVV